MSKIQQMRDFIATCPLIDILSNRIHIDWTDSEPCNYGIMPLGESIISTTVDIQGNKVVTKQANFTLYAMRFTIDDIVRLETAGFLEDFTEWIEDQSLNGNAPVFGDNPITEVMTAQEGMLFELSEDGRSGRYQIQINCQYEKHYKNKRNDF